MDLNLSGKQALFYHEVMNDEGARYVALFGGFASGKTTVGCLCGLTLALTYPGIKGAVVRNTNPELRNSTKLVFMDLLSALNAGRPKSQSLIEFANEQYNWVKLVNGSVVFFCHTSSDALFKGPEFGWFFLDQAEEMDEETVKKITSRLRQPQTPQKGMFTGNTDKGHNWCYRWFKLGQKPNSKLIEISFVDNKDNLTPAFFDEMMSYPDDWKKVNLYGSWDSPGGLVIEPTEQHVLKHFEPVDAYSHGIVIDPAESTGVTAVLYVSVDFDGNYVICDEYYEKARMIKEHADGIKKKWYEFRKGPAGMPHEDYWRLHPPSFVYADPRSWYKRQALETGLITLADRYRDHGIVGTPAVNDMEIGIDMVREMHEPHPDHKHIITGERPAPSLYFVKDKLPNLMTEIFSWMIEEPDKEPCHGVDCVRYLCATNPSKPRRKQMIRKLRRSSGPKSWMAK